MEKDSQKIDTESVSLTTCSQVLRGMVSLISTLQSRGDLYVDCHHTIEDVGIVLGKAIKEALGDKKAIKRFGNFFPADGRDSRNVP